MRYEKSAVVIQRCVRGYFVRRERIAYVRKVIVVQSCIRRWLAKRELRKLKVCFNLLCNVYLYLLEI
jgi:myosin-5